ncbi:MAG: ABC transporter permease [Actinomycetaceae bacterium]|nr:ABC transporter permease [Actinomycetaceae bacterium]
MKAAFHVEALKLTHSLVGIIATCAMTVGTLALLGGISAGIRAGNPELIAKAGPAASHDWDGLIAGATQISAVSSILGFGIVLAWLFSREFTDGTITGLFALPIRRGDIALAKLAVFVLWVLATTSLVVFGVLLLGLCFGYGMPGSEASAALGRLWLLMLFSAGITTPISWIATLTRSLLAAVSSTIAVVIIAQIGALSGAGDWVPLSAPALWALSAGSAVTTLQLTLSLAIPGVFTALVYTSWSRLQLNR